MRLLLSVLLAGVVATGFAQGRTALPSPVTTTGIVTGVVVDSGGAAVAGATVELLADVAAPSRTTTDRHGHFRFAQVPFGAYRVRAFIQGVGVAMANLTVADAAPTSLRLAIGAPDAIATAAPSPAPPASGKNDVMMDGISAMGLAKRHEVRARAPMVQAQSGARTFAMAPTPMAWNTEAYSRIDDNAFHRASDNPLSTFSIDVDTASYANVRRFLNDGALPPADAVRIEELLNYFRFDYPDPSGDRPFSVSTDVGPAPWNPEHRLVLVGLKARPVHTDRTPPRNLVFLLDVSGSMQSPDKLPLVKTAMRMLTATLTAADRVAIVVYAGTGGVVLPSTSGARKSRIERAIAELRAGGGTNGAAGIQLAYDIASRSFIDGGINRVILATDGDFNVGVTSQGELMRLVEAKRDSGVFLSVLGVGAGNLKDSTMEQLADRGNGNYSYLDSLHEARRVLVAEAGSTLVTVARDVKIQVEFNPARVGAYRLIGYENRILAHRDFNDDRKDAGEIGAGHTVTALYEIVPPGAVIDVPGVDPLRYSTPSGLALASGSDELLTVKLRYKQPDGDTSQLLSVAVRDDSGELSSNLGFSAAVAEFGMLLRDSAHKGASSWSSASDLARRHRGRDADGYRAEFVRLVELASALDAQRSGPAD